MQLKAELVHLLYMYQQIISARKQMLGEVAYYIVVQIRSPPFHFHNLYGKFEVPFIFI